MGLSRNQLMNRDHVIYFLRCPVTGLIRYVGRTSNPIERRSNHYVVSDGQIEKRAWVAALRERGLKYEFEVKTPPMSYAAACHVELRMIAMFELHCPGQLFNGHHVVNGTLRKVSGWRGGRKLPPNFDPFA